VARCTTTVSNWTRQLFAPGPDPAHWAQVHWSRPGFRQTMCALRLARYGKETLGIAPWACRRMQHEVITRREAWAGTGKVIRATCVVWNLGYAYGCPTNAKQSMLAPPARRAGKGAIPDSPRQATSQLCDRGGTRSQKCCARLMNEQDDPRRTSRKRQARGRHVILQAVRDQQPALLMRSKARRSPMAVGPSAPFCIRLNFSWPLR